MKVIIAGGRDVWPTVAEIAIAVRSHAPEMDALVVGMCPTGVDAIAVSYAREFGIPIMGYPADWKRYGKSAGPIRNRIMAGVGEMLMVFPGGKGTSNMIVEAERLNKPVIRLELRTSFTPCDRCHKVTRSDEMWCDGRDIVCRGCVSF